MKKRTKVSQLIQVLNMNDAAVAVDFLSSHRGLLSLTESFSIKVFDQREREVLSRAKVRRALIAMN